MRTRVQVLLMALAVILIAGWLLQPLEVEAWERVRKDQPALRFSEVEGAAGQGIILGLLSGARALIADLVWIRSYATWADTDLERTSALIQLAVGIDPRPLFFWMNGGRTLAYDMPVWRMDEAGGERNLPKAVVRRITEEQAGLALDFYERGLGYHPDEPWLLVDMANIYQRKLEDLESAAEYYRLASETPDAPWFTARVYAELLRRLGRDQEAYDWLVALYPRLPPDDPSATASIVLQRIRELEDTLGVPESEVYQPADTSIVE